MILYFLPSTLFSFPLSAILAILNLGLLRISSQHTYIYYHIFIYKYAQTGVSSAGQSWSWNGTLPIPTINFLLVLQLNGSVNGLKPRIYTTNTQTPILITLITCSVFLGFFPYFYLPLFILSISFPLNQLNKNQVIIN